eukprot:TRINITY_DN50118_c0_g1_i1.p1 TRINITY_DN50118_c0_g1~~TRINITY_DN50118_c0_g1_i1.p1  ORF type:complete len:248 (-),score=50.60 TRINITY_DN50118_c0_g1_i1:62-805(-)
MSAVEAAGLQNDTLVLVTGDNGPWECKCKYAGSSGPFTGQWQKQHGGGSSSKMTLWEGGHRQVGLAYWPGSVAPGVSHALASSLDFFPTLASLAGVPMPTDRSYDGLDLSAVLLNGSDSAHHTLFHPLSGACGSGELKAMRLGQYKAVWQTGGAPGCEQPAAPCVVHDPPLVFDLEADPSESAPLDLGNVTVGAVLEKMEQEMASKMANVQGTARSVANYSTSDAGRAANCCNPASPVCSCQWDSSN